jgi:arylsulfatase A-like enzyme
MDRLARLAAHVTEARTPPGATSPTLAAAAAVAKPPNVLLIVTDQQTHQLLSCAGTNWVDTPASDRLAAQGVRFTRAYATNPVCVPSRFSMFTGRMPSAIGLRHNQTEGGATFSETEDRQSLGHLLQGAGYRTLYGGKTHWPIGLTPERLGFERYFCSDERERLAVETAGLLRGELADSSQPWFTVASLINPHDICYHAIRAYAEQPGNEELQEARMVTNAQNREIDNLDEALLPPTGISREDFLRDHLPPPPQNIAPQQGEPEMIGELMDERLFRRHVREHWTTQDWQLHRWAYARLMERVDKQIGVIVDALDASGQAEDTVVILTSDHGDHDGSHGLEHKTILYDEAARVPYIMRHPGRIPAGVTDDGSLVSVGLDLMATCCDYAGLPQPAHCLGLSLRSAAEGGSGGSSHVARDYVYCENQVSYMVADASWKYVLYDHVSLRDTLRATHGVTRVTALQLSPSARMPVRGSCPPCRRTLATLNAALCGQGEGKEQLYDMANDPGETRNHLDQQDPAASKALQRMRVALERERAVRKRNCFFNVRSDQPACLVKLQCFCGNSNN